MQPYILPSTTTIATSIRLNMSGLPPAAASRTQGNTTAKVSRRRRQAAGYNRRIMTEHDRQLGMGSPISRRDFLNGVAIGIGGTIAAGWLSPDLETLLAQGQAGRYPPALTGLRGSHAGSFEAFHSMRDGALLEERAGAGRTRARSTIWWWSAAASAA